MTAKVNAWLYQRDDGGVDLRWKFPQLDGMAAWSTEEMGGRFVSSADGWFYFAPASEFLLRFLWESCPLPIACEDAGILRYQTPQLPLAVPVQTISHLKPQPRLRQMDGWQHQVEAFHWLSDAKTTARPNRGVGGLGMGMGTGKTKTLIDFAVNHKCHLVLVLCPASVFGAWRHGVRVHAPQSKVLICDEKVGSVKDKEKAINRFREEAMRVGQQDGRPWFVVINYESARMTPEFFGTLFWSLIALDESHRAKSHRGATHKLIRTLRITAPMRVCLSGTPMPHSPLDMFSQCLFLDSMLFGLSLVKFRKRYTITGWHREIVGWRNRKELSEKINQLWWFCGDEVLSLPPITISDVTFSLGTRARRIYRDLWRDFVASIGDGLVICDNALVKLLRCQQATCGFLPVTNLEGKTEMGITGSERVDCFADLLADIDPGEKVVVFARYREDLANIRRIVEAREWELNECKPGDDAAKAAKQAAGEWVNYRCGEVSGSRKDLTQDARLSPDFEVFAVQVFSGGVGVDFTAAAIAILYSIDYSLGNYDQMLKREHRPGQTRPVRVVRLICENSVDEAIYQAITDRRNLNTAILELARNERE